MADPHGFAYFTSWNYRLIKVKHLLAKYLIIIFGSNYGAHYNKLNHTFCTMKKHYINYLKPWTIIIVFTVLLSSSFFSCKEEEEVPEIPVCTLSPPNVSVESENGSVILLDDEVCILSESDKLWEGIPGLKSIIYPREVNFEKGPVDLSSSVGKRLKFSGVLDLIRRDTLTIEGVRQAVCVCDIRDYDLQFTGGSDAVSSSD